jgi:hypothetical protein
VASIDTYTQYNPISMPTNKTVSKLRPHKLTVRSVRVVSRLN